jgi:hypothetical protein
MGRGKQSDMSGEAAETGARALSSGMRNVWTGEGHTDRCMSKNWTKKVGMVRDSGGEMKE